MGIQATLINYDRVYRAISGLKDIEKDKVIKTALRTASNLFLRAGRSNLRSRLKGINTGNLTRSFKTKVKRKSLGALAGFNQFGMHSHLVDRGTVTRSTKKGDNRGKMTANNFWTDAINSNQNTAISKVYEGLERGVTKILMRV